MAVGIAGVATFGSACKGLLLLNYDLLHDRAAQLVVGATFISVLSGFPLVFLAMRDALATWIRERVEREEEAVRKSARECARESGVEATSQRRLEATSQRWLVEHPNVLSLGLCALCALGSLLAKDVAFVIALRGALLGSLVNFAIPALVFLRSPHGSTTTALNRRSHMAMAAYGLVGAAASTWHVVRLGLVR